MKTETFSTFDMFNCSSSSQTFTSYTKNFTFSFNHKLCTFIASTEARKYENSRKILNEPPQQRTARRIFHKIQFHEVFIRREISEMEIFPTCQCVCVKKNPPQHNQYPSRKCDSAIPEFLSLSVCAVSLNTKILQRAENDENSRFPYISFHGTLQFWRNDMDSCRKGEMSLFRRKCTLSIIEEGIGEELVSKWMR